MGIYERALVGLYKAEVSTHRVLKVPRLFLNYGMFLVTAYMPRVGYKQNLAPEYIHWKQRLTLPLCGAIVVLTYLWADKIKKSEHKREFVKEISPIQKK